MVKVSGAAGRDGRIVQDEAWLGLAGILDACQNLLPLHALLY
jgi:hypothetical protein